MLPISSPSFAALTAGVLIATVVDMRTRRIPNALTGTMASVGVALAAVGLSGLSVGASLLGLVVGLSVMLPGHVLGATGAGDVKLMAAVGAFLGPALAVKAFLFTAIAGGLLAVIVSLHRRRLSATLAATARMIAMPADARHEIKTAAPASRFAYGPAIAIGSMLAVLLA